VQSPPEAHDDASVTGPRPTPAAGEGPAEPVRLDEPVVTWSDTIRPSRRERGRLKRQRRSRVNRYLRRSLAIALVVLLFAVGWSYLHALRAPGHDPIGVKTVEWVRDHGGSGIVNRIEHWWYTHHQPPKGGTPKHGLPKAAPLATPTTAPPPAVPANITPIAPQPLPGEGVWAPTGKLVRGRPAVYATFLRPDPVHTSLVTGAAWMDTKLLKGALYNGLELPGGGPWSYGSKIDPHDYGTLIAAFNSGFKIQASRGGYYTEGKTVQPLVKGRASLIIKTDGTVSVGMWGRDARGGADIASVRQNLDLLVDNGVNQATGALNDTSKWGGTLGNKVFVWRSGVGIDRNGDLIYVGGNGLNITTLANVLVAAGAVRAMELDINSEWVSYFTYQGGAASGPITGVKLLPDMQRPANRYLQSGTRDFIALFAR
jgi:hypothetical protein